MANRSLAKEIWTGPIPEQEKKRTRKTLLPKGFQPQSPLRPRQVILIRFDPDTPRELYHITLFLLAQLRQLNTANKSPGIDHRNANHYCNTCLDYDTIHILFPI